MLINTRLIKILILGIFIFQNTDVYSSQNESEEEKFSTSVIEKKETKKRPREDDSIKELEEPKSKKKRISTILKQDQSQTYAIPTYDATFKYIMNNEAICLSFLKSFIPDENITSIKHLDNHLTPFASYRRARDFLNSNNSKKVINKIKDIMKAKEVQEDKFSISFINISNKKKPEENIIPGGEKFIQNLVENYGDILKGYPSARRNSQVDLLCTVDGKYYALVEVQVVPEDYWDKRALAYAANIYGRQLSKGEKWNKIQKVICINLLGGGPKDIQWSDRKDFRKLTFKDQNNHEIEEGIEILQYPLFYKEIRENSQLLNKMSKERQKEYLEWLDFFEGAHNKKEEDMNNIQSKEVKKAYEMIKESELPKEIREEYLQQESEFFSKYSQYTEHLKNQAKEEGKAEGREEGREEGRAEGEAQAVKKLVISMLEKKMDLDLIVQIANLPKNKIEEIKKEKEK